MRDVRFIKLHPPKGSFQSVILFSPHTCFLSYHREEGTQTERGPEHVTGPCTEHGAGLGARLWDPKPGWI